jgi:hypothetical protein
MTDGPTNDEPREIHGSPEQRIVPLHHDLGPLHYADAIESLRLAEGALGIFISQSLLLASRLKREVDPDAPVPDWL